MEGSLGMAMGDIELGIMDAAGRRPRLRFVGAGEGVIGYELQDNGDDNVVADGVEGGK